MGGRRPARLGRDPEGGAEVQGRSRDGWTPTRGTFRRRGCAGSRGRAQKTPAEVGRGPGTRLLRLSTAIRPLRPHLSPRRTGGVGDGGVVGGSELAAEGLRASGARTGPGTQPRTRCATAAEIPGLGRARVARAGASATAGPRRDAKGEGATKDGRHPRRGVARPGRVSSGSRPLRGRRPLRGGGGSTGAPGRAKKGRVGAAETEVEKGSKVPRRIKSPRGPPVPKTGKESENLDVSGPVVDRASSTAFFAKNFLPSLLGCS